MSKRRLLEAGAGLVALSCFAGLGACGNGSGGNGSGGAVGSGGASTGGSATGSGGTLSASGGTTGTGGNGNPQTGGDGGVGAAPGTGGASGGSTAGSGGADPSSGGSGGTAAGTDAFGITQLYPSAPGGAEWTSEHWDGDAYTMDFGTDDNDPSGLSGMRGTGTLEVTGDGELVMGGEQPRIYVVPGQGAEWQNVEVTVYYQRVEDTGEDYAGLVVGTRSGPDGHNTDTACDAHTYYARLRHDGDIDFEKELKHPASSTGNSVDAEEVWPPDGELPTGEWIGWKFVIYNLSSSSVQLESYRDLTLGVDGGDWVLMNDLVDDGGWSVETDCPEHDPAGGESDMVVTDGGAVLVRNTDITEARYRWLTVREIQAP